MGNEAEEEMNQWKGSITELALAGYGAELIVQPHKIASSWPCNNFGVRPSTSRGGKKGKELSPWLSFPLGQLFTPRSINSFAFPGCTCRGD